MGHFWGQGEGLPYPRANRGLKCLFFVHARSVPTHVKIIKKKLIYLLTWLLFNIELYLRTHWFGYFKRERKQNGLFK